MRYSECILGLSQPCLNLVVAAEDNHICHNRRMCTCFLAANAQMLSMRSAARVRLESKYRERVLYGLEQTSTSKESPDAVYYLSCM